MLFKNEKNLIIEVELILKSNNSLHVCCNEQN